MVNKVQFSLLSAIPYPAFIADLEQIIRGSNQAADRLFELDLVGIPIVRILRQPEVQACIEQALETENLQTRRLVLNITTPRTYQISAARFDRVTDEPKLMLITLLDVSAEIDAENSRSTFVANVSHELRSPLTSLLGVVETLQGPARSDEKARDRFLALMHDETQRMSRLVGDLLSLSKLESKEHVRPNDQVNVENTIKRVQSSLEASYAEYVGRINLDAPDALPGVLGDRDELTEVFQNLIENALKYSTPETPIEIVLRHQAALDQSKAGHVIVTIKDQGDGIAPEHLPRLTERFYRVDKGRSREMGGTGLGLAITKHILNRHRGKLSIDSLPGKGTTVTITLRV